MKNLKLYEYFKKENREALTEARVINESYYISFSFICLVTITFFTITNALVQFWEAVWINLTGIPLFLLSLFIYKKTDAYNLPVGILICTCAYIISGQHLIIERDSYHNMLLMPALTIFAYALIDNKVYFRIIFTSIIASALGAYLSVKYLGSTVKILTSFEKDMYFIISIIVSIYTTLKIVQVFVNQREEAFKKLHASNEKYKKLYSKNKKLLGLLTHDIVSPLFIIRTSAQLLNTQRNEPEEYRRSIERHGKAEKAISELLDKAKTFLAIEDGKMKLDLSRINLKDALDESVSYFHDEIINKDIKVKISLPSDQLHVFADETILKLSVLSNLISNAIKFSDDHKTIEFNVVATEKNVKIEVKDNGVGMNEELLQTIFDPQAKTTRLGTRGERGTGYGMPLAYVYVQEMGGELVCQSQVGVGTTFSFILQKA